MHLTGITWQVAGTYPATLQLIIHYSLFDIRYCRAISDFPANIEQPTTNIE
jgi:hypothetical protein